jgi:hypothetical protein
MMIIHNAWHEPLTKLWSCGLNTAHMSPGRSTPTVMSVTTSTIAREYIVIAIYDVYPAADPYVYTVLCHMGGASRGLNNFEVSPGISALLRILGPHSCNYVDCLFSLCPSPMPIRSWLYSAMLVTRGKQRSGVGRFLSLFARKLSDAGCTGKS